MSEIITEKPKASTPPQNLEDLLYQFFKLYDNWSLEQKLVGKREAEMVKSIESLDEKIQELDAVQAVVKQSIQNETKTAMGVIANMAGQEVKRYCHAEVDHLTQDLNRALSYAKSVIPNIERIEANYSMRLWALVVSVSVLVGFAAGAAWTAHNTISIDEFKQKVHAK